MKRSEINQLMREAVEFLNKRQFYLPKFAYWTLNDWRNNQDAVKEIINNQLGWDITDFGRGDFFKFGLILFTIRNGNLKDIEVGGKNYCEKVMIIEEGQITPMHYHFQKQEDIINRGGGELVIQVYNPTEDDDLAESPVTIYIDGVSRKVNAGVEIILTPGESVYIPPHLFHKFWVKQGTGKVLIGEVSSVNDDRVDNKFHQKIGRFAEIDEDEEPLYLLYTDYEKFLKL